MLGLSSPAALVANIIAVLIGMTIHEFAHNYVAHKMGDPVPRREGRLTLNPLVHINWLGFLMFVVIGFGPIGGAPISPFRMPAQNRRWRWLAAVAAGPVSNLLLAIITAIIYNLLPGDVLRAGSVALVLQTMIFFNVVFFVLNVLPLFPLDGWQIVYSLLPPDMAIWWERNQQNSYYVFIGLIFLSIASSWLNVPQFNILSWIINPPVGVIVRFLLGF